MDIAHIDWIPEGTRFGADEMTYFVGRGERSVDDALADIDLVVTGPHASAAFPAEMQPFVDVRLTKRLQYDFTDVSTSPVARRWAEIDPHVLYVEDPHPRAVRDANRPRPDDLAAVLREAFDRLDEDAPTTRPSLAGVDAVRPVTFGYLPVYTKPRTDTEWNEFGAALTTAGRRSSGLRSTQIAPSGCAVWFMVSCIDITSRWVAELQSATVHDAGSSVASRRSFASTTRSMRSSRTRSYSSRPSAPARCKASINRSQPASSSGRRNTGRYPNVTGRTASTPTSGGRASGPAASRRANASRKPGIRSSGRARLASRTARGCGSST